MRSSPRVNYFRDADERSSAIVARLAAGNGDVKWFPETVSNRLTTPYVTLSPWTCFPSDLYSLWRVTINLTRRNAFLNAIIQFTIISDYLTFPVEKIKNNYSNILQPLRMIFSIIMKIINLNGIRCKTTCNEIVIFYKHFLGEKR